MNGEHRLLVTYEPFQFEKKLVEVQTFNKITDYFRGIYGIYPNYQRKTGRSQHVTGWTKHKDFDRLCSKISSDTNQLCIRII
jgi:hypothetical protein